MLGLDLSSILKSNSQKKELLVENNGRYINFLIF